MSARLSCAARGRSVIRAELDGAASAIRAELDGATPRLAAMLNQTHRNPLAAGLAVLFLASVAGCQAAASLTLGGREFLSNGITEGGVPFQLVAGTRVRLGFIDANLTAQAGCNTFGATYRIEGGRLVVDGGAMTEIGCDEPRNQQDQWLFTFLGSNPAVTLAGTDLTLDNGRTSIRLVDRTIAEPDLNIVGPTWTVTSIIDGDAVSSVPAGVTASLGFRADGSVEVNAGCNRGRGSWVAQGTGITFRDVALTKMACDGPAATLENAVVAVLQAGSVQASIRSSSLTLQANGKGIQLTGR
jgi:heat shock protein HslJ